MEMCAAEKWEKAQEIEAAYWKKHLDVELVKQEGYCKMMQFDLEADYTGRTLLDLGGGPRSVLDRVTGAETRCVVDPIDFEGVKEYYDEQGI